ncbi:RCC1 domain-containing protein, partial [Thermoproteota archaeon]
ETMRLSSSGNNADVNPDVLEICNMINDDCNPSTPDGYYESYYESTETTCDDGLDNDCGGAADTDDCDCPGAVCVESIITGNPGLHGCALLSDGTVQCWGDNERYQFGVTSAPGTSYGDHNTPVDVDLGIGNIVDLSGGRYFTCALIDDGNVKCWGKPFEDYSIQGIEIIDIDLSRDADILVVGPAHACAILDDMSVECWGDGENGELGNGGDVSYWDGTVATVPGLSGVIDISLGEYHTCALVTDVNEVWCWGSNQEGQLGVGSEGLETGCDHSPCSYVPVQVTEATGAYDIEVGTRHSCAVVGGILKCWGYNQWCILSDADDGSCSPYEGDCTENFAPATPSAVSGKSDIESVSAGADFTCVLDITGRVQCWGDNVYGQSGDYPGMDGGSYQVCSLNTMIGAGAVQLTAGDGFACARTKDGVVWCWGSNYEGQLGFGNDEPYLSDTAMQVAIQ